LLAVPAVAGTTCDGTTRSGAAFNLLSSAGHPGFGLTTRAETSSNLDNNHQIRIDHNVSDKQIMSFRWLYDNDISTPSLNHLPGFDSNFKGIPLGGLFTDTYTINPRVTNEFRFNYGRIGFDFEPVTPGTLANYTGFGGTGFGIATNIPQFRFANNWQYQDTMSLVRGKHTFRFGADFLRQLARQHPPFNERGSFAYSNSTTAANVAAIANFVDDFAGRRGDLNCHLRSSSYHPNPFPHTYVLQAASEGTTNLQL